MVVICDRIRERNHFMLYNISKIKKCLTMAAMNFNYHPATLARNCEASSFRVWAGHTHVHVSFENGHFMPLFGGKPFGTGGLQLLTLDL